MSASVGMRIKGVELINIMRSRVLYGKNFPFFLLLLFMLLLLRMS